MRIVWILNSPIGEISNVLGLSRAQSGTWIDAAMESLLAQQGDVRLTILTTASMPHMLQSIQDGVTYICLPAGRMSRGRRATKKQLSLWVEAVTKIAPDLIHIWGTEFSLGYDLRELFPDIPLVYTMQGVMSYISKCPHLLFPDMLKNLSVFSKIRCLKYRKEQKMQHLQAKLEKNMIAKADGIISDNEWAISPFLQEENKEKFHFIRLPIKKQFQTERWEQQSAKEHTIFCIAGRNGLKGIHQMIEAAALLKEDFPNLQVLIPGNISGRKPSFLFEPPYVEYLKKIIARYGLKQNIRFLGQLTTDEMISYMKTAKVFVMPSAIENESATLREAMFLGMPVVTSFAGDIYETVAHGVNGLIYRFHEYEMLAYFVRNLLKDPEYSAELGQCAKQTMQNLYAEQNYGVDLFRIYETGRK